MTKPLKLIAIAIGVVLLAIVALYVLGFLDDGTGTTGVWTPTQGDFLEYEMTMGEAQYTVRMQIKEVTSTTMRINTTWTMVGGHNPYYMEETVSINQTFGWSYDLSNPPTGMTINDLGIEEIDTNWGWKSANRYIVSYSSYETWDSVTWDADIYVYKGVLLKLSISHTGQTTTLVDTNLRSITHG